MTNTEIISKIDHTYLKQTATTDEILALCSEAMKNNTASVCIPASYVKIAKEYLKDLIPVCTVIGFPNGYSTTSVKLFETTEAINDGAKEIDMVIHIGKLKEKNYDYLQNEISQIANICHKNNAILKVIIETCLLDDDEIRKMCFICDMAKADYIKTSTGFSTSGANFNVVATMINTINENNLNLKVKVAGGISSVEDAQKYILMGADRLGSTKLLKLLV